ncbi:MAG: serine hydrolase [Pirellulales bacterium]
MDRTTVLRYGLAIVLGATVMGSPPGTAGAADSLDEALRPLIEAHEGAVTAAVQHLDTGVGFAVRADRPMPLASLVKLPVMVAAYAAAHSGGVRLDEPITLRAGDLVPGSAVLEKLSPGSTFQLRDAIRMMIASSDNTATNLVITRIGLPATNNLLDRLGLGGIRLNSLAYRRESSLDPEASVRYGLGSGTAAEIVRLLAMIHGRDLDRRGIVADGACGEMIDHLLACEDRGMSPRSLPAGVKVAHKTGAVSGTRTDAGIMLGPAGPIAFCLLTTDNRDRRGPGGAADDLAARFARETLDFFLAAAPPQAPSTGPLGEGAAGALVADLQRSLNAVLPAADRLGTDGEYGPATAAGVRRFQKSVGLPETGVVDAATWRALGPLAAETATAPLPPLASQDDPAGLPAVASAAWAVLDAASGQMLLGHEADAVRSPASIVKVMTALVVLDEAAAEPAQLDEIVTVSTRAGTETGSSAGLRPGDRLTMCDLLYGLLLPSGNDAAVAIAEHVGGREGAAGDPLERFVEAMNDRAKAAGLERTTYGNPHGLTMEGKGSTARETAVLAAAAMKNELFREIVATRRRSAMVENTAGYRREQVWTNTNRLLGIEGYCGIKTGTTQAAGCCLAASADRGGRSLIVVVLGAPSTESRYVDARNLFRYAWRSLDIP